MKLNCPKMLKFYLSNKINKIEYINYSEDTFESDIDIDIVPLIILNNDTSQIFKGIQAYNKL